jgi:ketosteroid isomerase-like protein
MKTIIACFCLGAFLFSFSSCGDKTAAKNTENKDTTAVATSDKPAMDLPYKASYSANWTTGVTDEDLKLVLMSYKDWADGNIPALQKALSDTVEVDMSNGDHVKSAANIIKRWSTYRDSLSSVDIDMESWQKLYEPDKKDGYIVTWYKETDTYKNGKVVSGYYHDINQVKDGKIVWYSQYKRPAK